MSSTAAATHLRAGTVSWKRRQARGIALLVQDKRPCAHAAALVVKRERGQAHALLALVVERKWGCLPAILAQAAQAESSGEAHAPLEPLEYCAMTWQPLAVVCSENQPMYAQYNSSRAERASLPSTRYPDFGLQGHSFYLQSVFLFLPIRTDRMAWHLALGADSVFFSSLFALPTMIACIPNDSLSLRQ